MGTDTHASSPVPISVKPRGTPLYLGDRGDSGDENHLICSETLQLPTGPQTTRVFPDRVSGLIGEKVLWRC